MHVFDALEEWSVRLRNSSGADDLIVRFDRTPTDRGNPACGVNLRYGSREIDFWIWASGDADLVVGSDGSVKSTQHFDGILDREGLKRVLSEPVEFVLSRQSEPPT
jgi:hypothetical protein